MTDKPTSSMHSIALQQSKLIDELLDMLKDANENLILLEASMKAVSILEEKQNA